MKKEKLFVKAKNITTGASNPVFQANWNDKGKLFFIILKNLDGTLTHVHNPNDYEIIIERTVIE